LTQPVEGTYRTPFESGRACSSTAFHLAVWATSTPPFRSR